MSITICAISCVALLGLIIAYYSRRLHAARRSYRDQVAGLIHDNSKLRAEYDSLKAASLRQEGRIGGFLAAQESPADYYVSSNLLGYCTVFRRCIVRGETHRTSIKRFTDPDAEFNLLLAEELCDKLNEK